MDPFYGIVGLITLLGLVIGSFLNVVIYRVPRGESVLFPASHCPSCNTPIRSRHNVPVFGWLMLRGKCASCREPISPRYPLVEGFTGVVYGVLTIALGLQPLLPIALVLATVAITVAMIGLDGQLPQLGTAVRSGWRSRGR